MTRDVRETAGWAAILTALTGMTIAAVASPPIGLAVLALGLFTLGAVLVLGPPDEPAARTRPRLYDWDDDDAA